MEHKCEQGTFCVECGRDNRPTSGWEEEFDDEFMEYATENENTLIDLDTDGNRVKDFIRTLLSSQKKQWVEEVLAEAEKLALDVRKVDKTPKYEYSKNRCDANRDGEFPEEVGARWAMPWELCNSFVSVIRSKLQP